MSPLYSTRPLDYNEVLMQDLPPGLDISGDIEVQQCILYPK